MVVVQVAVEVEEMDVVKVGELAAEVRATAEEVVMEAAGRVEAVRVEAAVAQLQADMAEEATVAAVTGVALAAVVWAVEMVAVVVVAKEEEA